MITLSLGKKNLYIIKDGILYKISKKILLNKKVGLILCDSNVPVSQVTQNFINTFWVKEMKKEVIKQAEALLKNGKI